MTTVATAAVTSLLALHWPPPAPVEVGTTRGPIR
jgi:hypothetical protein